MVNIDEEGKENHLPFGSAQLPLTHAILTVAWSLLGMVGWAGWWRERKVRDTLRRGFVGCL